MTDWSREYFARLFGPTAPGRRRPGTDCVERDCTVGVTVRSPQNGPYAVTVEHNGVTSGAIVEDEYRESTALEELTAEWLLHEHAMGRRGRPLMEPAEFNRRWMEHYRIDGFGVEDVQIHFPCPWCAAADWAVLGLVEFNERFTESHRCDDCGRAGRWMEREPVEGKPAAARSFVFVTIDGGLPPELAVVGRRGQL